MECNVAYASTNVLVGSKYRRMNSQSARVPYTPAKPYWVEDSDWFAAEECVRAHFKFRGEIY